VALRMHRSASLLLSIVIGRRLTGQGARRPLRMNALLKPVVRNPKFPVSCTMFPTRNWICDRARRRLKSGFSLEKGCRFLIRKGSPSPV
jgi:hypothetical protein